MHSKLLSFEILFVCFFVCLFSFNYIWCSCRIFFHRSSAILWEGRKLRARFLKQFSISPRCSCQHLQKSQRPPRPAPQYVSESRPLGGTTPYWLSTRAHGKATPSHALHGGTSSNGVLIFRLRVVLSRCQTFFFFRFDGYLQGETLLPPNAEKLGSIVVPSTRF